MCWVQRGPVGKRGRVQSYRKLKVVTGFQGPEEVILNDLPKQGWQKDPYVGDHQLGGQGSPHFEEKPQKVSTREGLSPTCARLRKQEPVDDSACSVKNFATPSTSLPAPHGEEGLEEDQRPLPPILEHLQPT